MTAAAMQMVAMKVLRLRSYRVATLRQSPSTACKAGAQDRLEAAEHALDDVALLVDFGVAVELDLAVSFGWDDRRGASLYQPVTQIVAVIAFIADEFGRGRQGRDAGLGHHHIVDISGG